MRKRDLSGLVLLLTVAAVLQSGCAYKASYNPKYLAGDLGGGTRIDGEAVLLVERADEAYVYKGRPKSLTARGSTVEMPLGNMNKEIALASFGRVLRGGVKPVGDRRKSSGVHVIQTRVAHFEYRFNTLRNLTMANTPQIRIAIEIGVKDPGGRDVLSKTYATDGWYSGTTVLDTMKPAELINRTTHTALSDLYARAAADVESVWSHGAARPVERRAPDSMAPAPATRSAAERLRELRSLRDQGLVDEETYRRKEQEILEDL